MLEKKYLILITFLASIGFAAYDFSLFRIAPKIAFQTHNLLAFLVGAGLLYFSYKLIAKKSGNKYVNMLSMLVGFAMVIIHITKLVIDECI